MKRRHVSLRGRSANRNRNPKLAHITNRIEHLPQPEPMLNDGIDFELESLSSISSAPSSPLAHLPAPRRITVPPLAEFYRSDDDDGSESDQDSNQDPGPPRKRTKLERMKEFSRLKKRKRLREEVVVSKKPGVTQSNEQVQQPLPKKPKRALPNAPLPDLYTESIQLAKDRLTSQRSQFDQGNLSFDAAKKLLDRLDTEYVPDKFRQDPVSMANFFQTEKEPLDLSVPDALSPLKIQTILNPPKTHEGMSESQKTYYQQLRNLSTAERVRLCMRYINRICRIYTKGSQSKVIYKTINPDTGTCKPQVDSLETFYDRFRALKYLKVEFKEGPGTVTESEIESIWGGVPPFKASRGAPLINLWRKAPEGDYEKGEKNPYKKFWLTGWRVNVLKLWYQWDWYQVAEDVVFNPTPAGQPGAATNDVVNMWRGVACDLEKCKLAYDYECVYDEKDPRVSTFMHGWLQNEIKDPETGEVLKAAIRPGQTVHLWREVGKLYNHHLLNVLANGNKRIRDWIVTFFAHILVRPWKRVEKSLCVVGREGVGKTIVFEALKRLLGPEYVFTTTTSDDVLGDFNDNSEYTILVIFEEASSDPETSKKLSGPWKRAITEDYNRIRKMYSPPQDVRNYKNFVAISNLEEMVPWTDRRLSCSETSNFVESPEYYETLAGIITANGHPRETSLAVKAWAYEHIWEPYGGEDGEDKLETWKRKLVPQTKVYKRMMIRNLGTVQGWLYRKLQNCDGDWVKNNPLNSKLDAANVAINEMASTQFKAEIAIAWANQFQTIDDGYKFPDAFDENTKEKLYTADIVRYEPPNKYYAGATLEQVQEVNPTWLTTYLEPFGWTPDSGKAPAVPTHYPNGDRCYIPQSLWAKVPQVTFPFNLKEFVLLANDQDNPEPRTWVDAAYYLWDLHRKEAESARWTRLFHKSDIYDTFKKDMLAKRKVPTDPTKFYGVVRDALGGRNAKGLTELKFDGEIYWFVPKVEVARRNWSTFHYCADDVFTI